MRFLNAMEEPDSLDDVFTEIEENMQKELVERRECRRYNI